MPHAAVGVTPAAPRPAPARRRRPPWPRRAGRRRRSPRRARAAGAGRGRRRRCARWRTARARRVDPDRRCAGPGAGGRACPDRRPRGPPDPSASDAAIPARRDLSPRGARGRRRDPPPAREPYTPPVGGCDHSWHLGPSQASYGADPVRLPGEPRYREGEGRLALTAPSRMVGRGADASSRRRPVLGRPRFGRAARRPGPQHGTRHPGLRARRTSLGGSRAPCPRALPRRGRRVAGGAAAGPGATHGRRLRRALEQERPGWTAPDEAVELRGRNLVLLSKALVAAAIEGWPTVALGSLAGNPFPDATRHFFAGIATVASEALRAPLAVVAPYRELSKADVIRRC